MPSPNVLVISDAPEAQMIFAGVLGRYGIAPIVAPDVTTAQTILSGHSISLVFCSDEMPDGGIDIVLRETSQSSCKVPVVVVSRLDDWGRFLDFLKAGAFDYVLYPPRGIEIDRIVKRALDIGASAMEAGAI